MTTVTVLRGAILAFAVAACASPPSRTPTVLLVPGKSIEVVGLQRWTIAMMQDSLAKYAPGTTLDSHACAAALRYQLGFADAAATSYELPGDSLERVVVIVVEPQDSARVRHRIAPMDTLAPRHEWAPVILVLSEHPGPFQMSLWRYRAWRGGDSTALRGLSGADSIAVLGVWRFLAAHASLSDREAALSAVHADPNFRNRMAAVALLSNFTNDDRVLHALLRAQLEADGPVGAMASLVLSSFTQTSPRPVDWGPVAPELHQMLRGTALFHLTGTMRLLAATGVDSSLALPLLRDGGEMLLAFAAAEHTDLRDSAHRLLVALRGKDLGHDAEVWAHWVRGL
ncbi:MAG: hypothetical protein IPJ78_00095 [Gemmatimonadetes bacterium]|nr:hypothetical protein [Gemmatimonadota bacterium]